ncbi:MAG TPA: cardiolipin synthase [Candidatus Sumerlaeota bacterium]|nr:cardiolipin synthase [Candidatus Sumerlaeota bacterium]HON51372.1 cardiolipin synthase [Candidatus Sumerlaeota bacterium]HOR64575.1 cardiolipin synthase [Candidatus Sumerlaeota bacterium]HPL73944.1 cardiolipin synthase [Candidatus Sumerlaeota bacterium]HRU54929.1 cardiolipin synthase [Candidatus Sumerlaeia bacterium]
MSNKLLLEIISVCGYLITLGLVLTALKRKREPVSALAWSLAIIFLPFIGAIAFILFGNNHIHRPLKRKKRQRRRFHTLCPTLSKSAAIYPAGALSEYWSPLRELMTKLTNIPATSGNEVSLYYEGNSAYGAMYQAIDSAKKYIYLQSYIFQNDHVGKQFIERLAAKAKQGVKVRLLYDAIGSHKLRKSTLEPLIQAGGRAAPFLPINILRRRIQVNLRNHRKILVVDGKTGFIGGMNIGKEYLGEDPNLGYWRDTHLKILGPTVGNLAYVFAEDWNFASHEQIEPDEESFPDATASQGYALQIISGGPDQDVNAIREWYYTVAARARQRLWISTPYFIPDETMIDGLRMAANMGVDVRLLTQGQPPDQWLPYLAARYYWEEMLAAGVRIWRYGKGMFHAKVILADGLLASVGTANFNIRSLHLDFEVNCLIYSPVLIAELENRFLQDLADSEEVNGAIFKKRPGWIHAAENACRLFSPIL